MYILSKYFDRFGVCFFIYFFL